MLCAVEKICSRCGGQKHNTGSRWRCSACYNAWQSEWRQQRTPEQRAKMAATQAASRRKWSPERRAAAYAYVAEWRDANREYTRQRAREYYAANVEWARAAKLAEYYRNPEPFLARNFLRKARLLEAICEHGPKCVDTAFLRDVYAKPCLYCGDVTTDADHFQPLARDGLHCRENIVPSCGPCNGSKKDRDPMEWLASRST